jgi:hypothetical protein
MVLAGRVRKQEEDLVVREVIQKHFKRKVDPDRLFTLSKKTSSTTPYNLCNKRITVILNTVIPPSYKTTPTKNHPSNIRPDFIYTEVVKYY